MNAQVRVRVREREGVSEHEHGHVRNVGGEGRTGPWKPGGPEPGAGQLQLQQPPKTTTPEVQRGALANGEALRWLQTAAK